MSFDITSKRAHDTAKIELVDGDGSPLLDDDGNQLFVIAYGPGSKRWKQADAESKRKQLLRAEKARGKLSATIDYSGADKVDFLVAVTIGFEGLSYPAPTEAGWPTSGDMIRAIYEDDTLGFIRDHVHEVVTNWENFTKRPATN